MARKGLLERTGRLVGMVLMALMAMSVYEDLRAQREQRARRARLDRRDPPLHRAPRGAPDPPGLRVHKAR